MLPRKLADLVAKLPPIMDGYKPRDIENGEEIELFFYAFPRKLCV